VEGNWSWRNLRYYPGVCLENLRKTMKNLSQDSRSPGQDLDPGPPKYEAGVLTTRPRRSGRTVQFVGSSVMYSIRTSYEMIK
jgi:hypothetical protein